jgi:mRNA interferase MazF
VKSPSRGEIWVVNLNPTKGHEQAGKRPFHVEVEPPEGNLDKNSYIKCEDIRSISKLRLEKFVGETPKETIKEVEDRLRILLNL